MGAQRIAANFGEIEQKATNNDNEKEMESTPVRNADNDDAGSDGSKAKISSRFLMEEFEKKVCRDVL